jgi:drug/metabolite transporter (DMT)-like permease
MNTPSTEAARRLRALEWAGCALGLLGAFLVATNTSLSRYGWIAFMAANFAVIGFARGIRANGLLVQQLGFMVTSILGLVRAFWPH